MSSKKTIDTLIPDFYALFTDGHISEESLLEHYGKMVAKNLGESLSRSLEEREPRLRMSAIGKPSRQIFYELSKAPREPFKASTLIKFQYGHLLEEMILYLAKEAGHLVEDEQKEVDFKGIKGHMDARVDRVKIDVKSASDFSFKKFKDGSIREDDAFNYIPQLAGYQQADTDNPNEDGAFLVINKVTGELCLSKFPAAELAAVDIKGHVERQKKVSAIVASKDLENVPERCFEPVSDGGKAGNMILGVNCRYCPFKVHCWRDMNDGWGLRSFNYYGGPKFFTHIEKEPRTQELMLPEIK